LGKLCAPFLERVSLEAAQGRDVHLESVARSMNVEKRRIYDIVRRLPLNSRTSLKALGTGNIES